MSLHLSDTNHFGGMKVVIREPLPMYKRKAMFKKHRKKKSRTIVKVFSHWQELIENGSVISDIDRGIMYMNRVTYAKLILSI